MLSRFLSPKKWSFLVLILVMVLAAGCKDKKEDDDKDKATPTVEVASKPEQCDDFPVKSTWDGKSPADKPVIKIVVSPWDGAEVNAEVAKYLIENELGYPVEFVEGDGDTQFDILAAGEGHVSLELWPSSHLDQIDQLINEEKKILCGSELGVIGKEGWFVPSYVLRTHPELATWHGYQDPELAVLFDHELTEGNKGLFAAGDPDWGNYDEQIIENLGMNFEVLYQETEQGFLEFFDPLYKAEQPIVFYFWTPHWAFNVYDLTEVELPPNTPECFAKIPEGGVDCGYPAEVLFKLYWAGLPEYTPEVYEFLENFHYTNRDQIAMMATMRLEDKTAAQAAEQWIKTHEDVWSEWLPE